MGTILEVKNPGACHAGQLCNEICAAVGREVEIRLSLGDPVRLRFVEDLTEDEQELVLLAVAQHDGAKRCADDAAAAAQSEDELQARAAERRETLARLRAKRRKGEPLTDEERDALLDHLLGV